ncbi:MAG: SMI1/KNR4 family protein [Bacteroidales bacterium]|jgi:tetratricopeptide (TPR) repeat protein|nr:SMI1/KNR4 family protein [Bacteroidales bacterium]
MPVHIHKVLERLDNLIGNGPVPAFFKNPAPADQIRSFEKRLGLRLPESYKAFLQYANGGMIITDELNSVLDYAANPEDVKWNANYLYSIEEVEEKYKEMQSWNYGIPFGNVAPYPFIPFCHTESGEHLVFINLKAGETESVVLDAYHEETPETWGVVAGDFTAFLEDYVNSSGYPNVLGELENGSALDFIEDDIEEEEPSPEHILLITEKKLNQDPDDDWQHALRGMAYRDLGNYPLALEHLNRAIELDPTDAYYYFCRGSLLLDAGKTRPALIDFDIAVKFDPDDPLYLNMRAIALMDKGKLSRALSDLDRAIEIDGKNVLSYMLREKLYTEMGESEKAARDAAMVEKLEKEDE